MFKIQVKANNHDSRFPTASLDLLHWQDMERAPDFANEEQAKEWMTKNKTHDLEKFGIEFQIIQK